MASRFDSRNNQYLINYKNCLSNCGHVWEPACRALMNNTKVIRQTIQICTIDGHITNPPL